MRLENTHLNRPSDRNKPCEPDAPSPGPAIADPIASKLTKGLCRHLLDPDAHPFDICDQHNLTLPELRAIVESEHFKALADHVAAISAARQTLITPAARLTAIAQLADLAESPRATSPLEARAAESARRAATALERATRPKTTPHSRTRPSPPQTPWPAGPNAVPWVKRNDRANRGNSMRNTAAAAILACTTPAALAQPFIEIGMTGEYAFANVTGPMYFRAVFDASAPPDRTTATRAEFDAIDAAAVNPGPSNTPSPMGTFAPATDSQPERPATATLTAIGPGLQYSILVSFEGNAYSFNLQGPTASIGATLTSLPDDPEAFLPNPNDPTRSMSVTVFPAGSTLGWSDANGFTERGSFRAWARVVDDPRVEPCPADLNMDGLINFFDIQIYLRLFKAGCP